MNALAPLEDLPAALALEVDAVCDDFERHWRRSRRRGLPPPEIGPFLARVSPSGRAVLAGSLANWWPSS